MFILFLHYMTSSIITLSWFSWRCTALSCSWPTAAWSKESNRARVSYVMFDRLWVSGILSSTTECFPMCELYFSNHNHKTFSNRQNSYPYYTFLLLCLQTAGIPTHAAQENSPTNSCVREYTHFETLNPSLSFNSRVPFHALSTFIHLTS
jgi:hypothetical protein